jgi:hypothetical protein
MKQVTPKKSETVIEAPAIRILKIANCPSLSGKSALTYHVGCTDSSEIQFRVFGNSGGGYFSNEWIALTAIEQAIAKVPNGIAITAHVLFSLFQGKSANSTGFLFAVLKGEGLVQPMTDKKGSYERADVSGFMAEVKALIESAVDLKVEASKEEGKTVKSAIPVPDSQQKSEAKVGPVAKKSTKKAAAPTANG